MLDKVFILENIRYISKIKGIPMSEVEKAGGVSTGYIARLISDIINLRNAKTSPSNDLQEAVEAALGKERPLPTAEVMFNIAEKLGVSLDTLMTVNFRNLSDTEFALIFFLDGLTSLTKANKAIWIKETEGEVLSGAKYHQFESHPLAKNDPKESRDYYDKQIWIDNYSYYSHFNKDTAKILGNIYRLEYKNNVFLLAYIRDYRENNSYFDCIELYGLQGDKVINVAHSTNFLGNNQDTLYKVLGNLYNAAAKNADINPNGTDLMDLINSYIDSLGLKK